MLQIARIYFSMVLTLSVLPAEDTLHPEEYWRINKVVYYPVVISFNIPSSSVSIPYCTEKDRDGKLFWHLPKSPAAPSAPFWPRLFSSFWLPLWFQSKITCEINTALAVFQVTYLHQKWNYKNQASSYSSVVCKLDASRVFLPAPSSPAPAR